MQTREIPPRVLQVGDSVVCLVNQGFGVQTAGLYGKVAFLTGTFNCRHAVGVLLTCPDGKLLRVNGEEDEFQKIEND